jgi:hypothetical protein
MARKYTRKHRRNLKNRKRSGRKGQRGGATPYYSFGSAVAPGAPYAAKVEVHDTPNVTRPGFLTSTNAGTGGLPGFTGGGRRRGRGTRRRAQRGGRYTVDLAGGVGSTGPNVFAPVSRIACEGGYVNPLNPGPHTGSSQPPLRGGGKRSGHKRSGYKRSGPTRKQKGGVGGIDSAAYYAPTAGYGNTPSTWVSSTGTPSMLQTPYAAGAMTPACLKTGGGKRNGRKYRGGTSCRNGRCGY